eukprot:Nitzschia sp. Nitz4//scaffold91_size79674//26935//28056//NITZ4_005362-RA/size79674-processed-gene-0.105-mRNA-1//-1//CDS//3329560085//4220//frame0
MYRRRSKCGTSNSVYAPSKQLIQQSIQQINHGPASHRKGTQDAAAICVLQKDEDLYLLEWINYHLALGFDDIYIFDDGRNLRLNSTDRVHVVSVTDFPKGTHKQIAIYNSCVEVIRQRQPHYNTSIVALLDVDEFLVLRQHNSVHDFMNDKCPRDRCGSLVVNWLWYGTGGNQTSYADEPVVSRFRLRDPVPHTTVKSLFRLEHFYCVTNQHFVHLTSNPMTMIKQQHAPQPPFSYDTHGNITFQAAFTPDHPYMDVASVHHYTKSMEEWYERRCVRGDVVKFDLRCTGAYPDSGSVYDTSAHALYEQNVPEVVRQWSNRQMVRQAAAAAAAVDPSSNCPAPFVCSLQVNRPWVSHDPSKFNVREIVPLNSFE